MKNIKIYLGDLTHETITISSDTMPLNIGFLGAYLKKQFREEVDVQLFKSPKELIEKIKEQAPDVLGLGNYCWNFELSYFFCEFVKAQNPNALVVMGGANFPNLPQEQHQFLQQRPTIDFYIYQEGELSFCDLLGKFMQKGLDVAKTKQEPIQGCLHLFPETQELINGGLHLRIKDLSALPSPYLSGVMDKFFHTKLNPFIQTNRGCPFTCSFCHEGDRYYSSVNFFPVDRIVEELDYIRSRLQGQTVLTIADSNFGMFRQDIEICKKIRAIQDHHGYPKLIHVTTGKNRPDLILETIQTLEKGTIRMTASVQSLDAAVLENIQRKNIEWQTYIDIQRKLHEMDSNYSSMSEVILALPGETKASHFETIRKLIEVGVDRILVYTLMMLYGTYLSSQAERKKYAYLTKYRIIPRSFGEFEGYHCIEVEEVGVANKDMSFEDYKDCRKMSLLLTLVYNNKNFKELFYYLKEKGRGIYPFLLFCFERMETAESPIKNIVADFMRETEEELWNSPEALFAYYKSDDHFAKLLDETLGGNLLQKYWAKGVAFHFDTLTDFVFDCARQFLLSTPESAGESLQEIVLELANLKNFTLFKRDRIFDLNETISETVVTLDYDIESWLTDLQKQPLARFKGAKHFKPSQSLEQRQLLSGLYQQYGTSTQAVGKISTRVNIHRLERELKNVAIPEARG